MGWFSLTACLPIPRGKATLTLMRTPLTPANFRSSHTFIAPSLREQGLTVGELLLIVLVILAAVGGAWLFVGSQQPAPSDGATVQPSNLKQPY